LEQWVLCHLTRSGRYFPQCIEAEKEVRKRLPLYQKTEDFFTRKKPDIYTRLKPYQAEAIKHAKQLGSFHIEEPSQAKAEMYKLIEDLLKIKN
ncbi:MAG: RloB domain-containing protein, partial [Bacteroidota bacterium]